MKTILICDDARFIIEVAKKILTRRGYSVHTLEDCSGFIEQVKKIKPHLILMDLMIPPSGGESAIKDLKEDEETANIPVYIFSAHPDLEETAKRIGADGHFNKPFETKQLEALVDDFFNEHSHDAA